MTKRIVFDPGIPVKSMNLTRYNRNPVLIRSHNWSGVPIGFLANFKAHPRKNQLSGRPIFHKLTDESKEMAMSYNAGLLNAYIGGEATRNEAGEIIAFKLYEISLAP